VPLVIGGIFIADNYSLNVSRGMYLVSCIDFFAQDNSSVTVSGSRMRCNTRIVDSNVSSGEIPSL